MLDPFSLIFGRTGLILGVSEAKNAGEADFDVKTCVALQKPGQKSENHMCRTQTRDQKFFEFLFFSFFLRFLGRQTS